MQDEMFSRTLPIIGEEGLNNLFNSHVVVFGVGGVGGYVVEALARTGVGEITVVDNDVVNVSNINRQIIAMNSTLGKYKVDVIEQRIKDINPNIKVHKYNMFFNLNTEKDIDFSKYNYIIDAIDTVSSKIRLVEIAKENLIPIISSMGAGNKIDPTMFEVSDIYKTSVCPLARVMRQELKKRDIKKLKVVYSKEQPLKNNNYDFPASIAFVPSVVGLIIAGEVIKELINY